MVDQTPLNNARSLCTVEPSVAALNNIPSFWKADPVLWFCKVEAILARSQITSSLTKFHIVVASLDFDIIQQAADIVKAPGSSPYEELKKRLIDTYAKPANRCIQQVGDEKPSQLLRHMRQLGGNSLQTETLRSLWLRSLPNSTQKILAATDIFALDKLSDIADKIHEIYYTKEVLPVSAANAPSKALLNEIENLTREMAKLKAELSAGSRRRRERSRQRARSKSSDRKRNDSDWLCFYHYKFRERAKKCESPCNWNRSGQYQSRW